MRPCGVGKGKDFPSSREVDRPILKNNVFDYYKGKYGTCALCWCDTGIMDKLPSHGVGLTPVFWFGGSLPEARDHFFLIQE
jgi:hypothetical protein